MRNYGEQVGLDGLGHLEGRSCKTTPQASRGGREIHMTRFVLLVLGLLLVLAAGAVQAQNGNPVPPQNGNPVPRVQSLKPSLSPCGAGSQSVRVCNDDFRSCSSVCTATALDPSAEIAGCSLRCCTQFKACLSIRGCASPTLECF